MEREREREREQTQYVRSKVQYPEKLRAVEEPNILCQRTIAKKKQKEKKERKRKRTKKILTSSSKD